MFAENVWFRVSHELSVSVRKDAVVVVMSESIFDEIFQIEMGWLKTIK